MLIVPLEDGWHALWTAKSDGSERGRLRAVHQMLERGAIFKDPLASRLLDERTTASLSEIAADESLRPWRLFIAARSRFSEDTMADCIAAGARQVVVLGAGLDTFSCEIRLPISASAYSKSITLGHNLEARADKGSRSHRAAVAYL